jgi:Flp pilus assembly protein TadD
MTRYDREPSIDSAIEILETLGDSPRVQSALGNAYLAKFLLSGRDKAWALKAKGACERARAANADDPEIHRTLGKLYVNSSKFEEADGEFRRALELRPNDADTRIAYADLLDKLDRQKEAEAQFRKAIALRPGNWSGYNQLGTFFLRRGRLEQALETFGDAERLTSGNTYAITNAGVALQWLGRYDEALDTYDRSIRVRPTGPAFNNKGTLLYMLGRFDDAADAFERATALNPNDYQLWTGLSDARRWSEKDKARAPAAYRKAIELAEAELDLNPRDATILSILAGCHAKLGNSEKATSVARLAVETAPDSMIVNYNSGVAMEIAGDRRMAELYIKRALDHGYTTEELRRDPELTALASETKLLTGDKGGA